MGDEVAARDPKGTWYVARVADARGEGASRELLVHYLGWSKKLDEWLGVTSDRLQRVEDVEVIFHGQRRLWRSFIWAPPLQAIYR